MSPNNYTHYYSFDRAPNGVDTYTCVTATTLSRFFKSLSERFEKREVISAEEWKAKVNGPKDPQP